MQRGKENIMARKSMPFPESDSSNKQKFIQFSVSLKMFYDALVVFFRACQNFSSLFALTDICFSRLLGNSSKI
jgi:hypothetical protein